MLWKTGKCYAFDLQKVLTGTYSEYGLNYFNFFLVYNLILIDLEVHCQVWGNCWQLKPL